MTTKKGLGRGLPRHDRHAPSSAASVPEWLGPEISPHPPRYRPRLLAHNLMTLCAASQKQTRQPLITPGCVSYRWIRKQILLEHTSGTLPELDTGHIGKRINNQRRSGDGRGDDMPTRRKLQPDTEQRLKSKRPVTSLIAYLTLVLAPGPDQRSTA
ncbi:hypothetical protein KOW79_017768 [Hemibagrus wyckioides]|uniref:Uncharacterized protein n=1 Tax=Hemibagrus wyckioides TaxID=337641 RepID=A0A9D3SHJ5_9TELE|nr:hypothetical protein KOW79_017768 [Hemibagrus wyckioides]